MPVIGTAGHVDHGKSALVQRLTGIDPDRFEEEKRRGLTIDLGFAWMTLPSGTSVGIVDVPGHERFIRNMLAGAGAITACLFVVAANEGWMPQSAEHLTALHVLGIEHGIVALTKSDLVDEETLDLARFEVMEHLTGTTLEAAPVIACSSLTGKGIDELIAALDDLVRSSPGAPDQGDPRLWIDRVFTISGAGTVVTGTTEGGSLAAGQEIDIAPTGRRARIRAIQNHQREVDSIAPGNRAALNLVGVDKDLVERGDAVVLPGRWQATDQIDVVLEVPPAAVSGHGGEIEERGSHHIYVGSAETMVRLRLLDRAPVAPGKRAYARLALRHPLPLRRGDRFVLRDSGRMVTLGGGRILDPLPGRAFRRDEEHASLLRRLDGADPATALKALAERHSRLEVAEAAFRSGWDEAGPLPEGVHRLDDLVVSAGELDRMAVEARRLLGAHHRTRPLERGMPREELRLAVGLAPGPFNAFVSSLPDVEQEGSVVHLSGHSVALDPDQARLADELVSRLYESAFSPPLADEFENDDLLRALAREGRIVRVGPFYLEATRADEAKTNVVALIKEQGPLSISQIRDALATSRKYAVPLSEWLDSEGVTRRQGDLRILGPRA